MPISLSPSVDVTERDLTLVAPAVATTNAAFVGAFKWGPVLQRVLVESENRLVARMGKPDDDTAVHFFVAADFLSYGRNLNVVRVVGDQAFNASTHPDQVAETFDGDGTEQQFSLTHTFPGNSVANITVLVDGVVLDPVDDYTVAVASDVLTITFATAPNAGSDNIVVYANTNRILNEEVFEHMSVLTGSFIGKFPGSLVNDVTILVATPANWASLTLTQKNLFQGTPVGDELHIAIIDTDGNISGLPGTVLERYDWVSTDPDATFSDGSPSYYVRALNDGSAYVWSTGNLADVAADGTAVLGGGVDDQEITSGQKIQGMNLFADAEQVDVSLILAGAADQSYALHILSIVDSRKDCVAFISPRMVDVVNNPGDEVTDVNAFRNLLPSTSYGFCDGNWKLRYDPYNSVNRWVPCNGDTAGLCARTDETNDPWWSPAGLNRGQLKNVIRLAWNPTKTQRDELYKNGINPIVSMPGQGTVLFGDKTMLSRPSAFDRINVRRLFIVLEKSISTAAKYLLFEFNDEFTRAQFRNLVEPYLRDVQGRRGIARFNVVANEENNTAQVINENRFVGDIYIDPARSINNIQLNFIATPSGVEFEEIEYSA